MLTFPDLRVGDLAIIVGNCPPDLIGHRVIKLMAPRGTQSRTAVYDLDAPTVIPYRGNQAGYLCRRVEWELVEQGGVLNAVRRLAGLFWWALRPRAAESRKAVG